MENLESILNYLRICRFIPEDSFFKNEKFFDFESKSNEELQTTPKVQIPSSSILSKNVVLNGSAPILNQKIHPSMNTINNLISRKR